MSVLFTGYGNAITSTTDKKFGTASAYFDGNGDYITADDVTDFDFGNGDFTVEWWEYRIANVTNRSSFSGLYDSTNYNFILNYSDYSSTARADYFRFVGDGGATKIQTRASGAGAPLTGAWFHQAVVRNGSHIYIYENGTRIYDYSGAGTKSLLPFTDFRIGRSYNGTASYDMYGYIDEVRVSKGIARYTDATLTIPTEPYSVDEYDIALLHMDGDNGGTVFTNSANEYTISSLSPLDDSIIYDVSQDLVLTLDGETTASTGNIVIYNSNDSVFQTIAADSEDVVIDNTEITISHNDFGSSNDYYVLIDSTAFDNFTGITDETTWNFGIRTQYTKTITNNILNILDLNKGKITLKWNEFTWGDGTKWGKTSNEFFKTISNLINTSNNKLVSVNKIVNNVLNVSNNKLVNITKTISNLINISNNKLFNITKTILNNLTINNNKLVNITKTISNLINIRNSKLVNITKTIVNNLTITTITFGYIIISKIINGYLSITNNSIRMRIISKIINSYLTVRNTLIQKFFNLSKPTFKRIRNRFINHKDPKSTIINNNNIDSNLQNNNNINSRNRE